MFNKETHTHTYMSDKAAKRLAKSNEKIAKEQREADERAARDAEWEATKNRWHEEELAQINSSSYQERLAAEEAREHQEKREVISEARWLVKHDKGDAFVKLLQIYQQYEDSNYEIKHAIEPLLQGLVVEPEKENIDLFFTTLDRHKSYIETFQKNSRIKRFKDEQTNYFATIYNHLVEKGDKAYDLWYAQNPYQTTEDDLQAEKEIEELKNETRTDAIIDILNYYPKLSVTHPHGSQKGKEMNPVALNIIDYLFTFKAPTDRNQLEQFLSLLDEKKEWLKNLGKKHPTLSKKNEYGFGDDTFGILNKAANRVISEQYKDVTDGLIGQRNSKRNNKKKIWIAVGVFVVLFILYRIIRSMFFWY